MVSKLPKSVVIGARLRELRLDAELSQREVGARMKLDRAIVARIERGKHEQSLRVIRSYAAALGLDAATVLVCLDPRWTFRVRRRPQRDLAMWFNRVAVRRAA